MTQENNGRNPAATEKGPSFSDALPRLLPKLNALASRFADGSDRDDMVQEGLIALYICSVSFDPERGIPFDAYALTCARRRMISAARKNANVLHINISDLEDSPELACVSPSPDEYAVGKENLETLRKMLVDLLSPYEQSVLSLYLSGNSYKRISARLGKSEKSVGNALSRVKAKLSRRFRDRGDDNMPM